MDLQNIGPPKKQKNIQIPIQLAREYSSVWVKPETQARITHGCSLSIKPLKKFLSGMSQAALQEISLFQAGSNKVSLTIFKGISVLTFLRKRKKMYKS